MTTQYFLLLLLHTTLYLTMAAPSAQDTLPSSLEAPPHPTREFKGNTDLKHCDDSFPNDLFWIDKITVQPEKLYMYVPPPTPTLT